jgi:hypothetical protein
VEDLCAEAVADNTDIESLGSHDENMWELIEGKEWGERLSYMSPEIIWRGKHGKVLATATVARVGFQTPKAESGSRSGNVRLLLYFSEYSGPD